MRIIRFDLSIIQGINKLEHKYHLFLLISGIQDHKITIFGGALFLATKITPIVKNCMRHHASSVHSLCVVR